MLEPLGVTEKLLEEGVKVPIFRIRDRDRPLVSIDFATIDSENYYWGDTVGVFQRPERYPSVRAAVLRAPVRMWANRIGGLEGVPKPQADPDAVADRSATRRRDVLGVAGRR